MKHKTPRSLLYDFGTMKCICQYHLRSSERCLIGIAVCDKGGTVLFYMRVDIDISVSGTTQEDTNDDESI